LRRDCIEGPIKKAVYDDTASKGCIQSEVLNIIICMHTLLKGIYTQTLLYKQWIWYSKI